MGFSTVQCILLYFEKSTIDICENMPKQEKEIFCNFPLSFIYNIHCYMRGMNIILKQWFNSFESVKFNLKAPLNYSSSSTLIVETLFNQFLCSSFAIKTNFNCITYQKVLFLFF